MEASHVWQESFRFSLYLGLCPRSFSQKRLLSKMYLAYCIVLKITFGLAVAGLVYVALQMNVKRHFKIVFIAFSTEAYLVTTFLFAYIHWREADFLELLEAMKETDSLLDRMDLKPSRQTRSTLALFGLLIIAMEGASRPNALDSFTNMATLCCLDSAVLLSAQPFAAILYNLSLRLAALKKSMASPGPRRAEEVARVLRLHGLLCSTCERLNSLYSLHLLYIFSRAIIMFTWQWYAAMLTRRTGGVLWTLHVTLALMKVSFMPLYITTVCRQASNEANSFNSLVYHLMINDDNHDILTNRKLLFHTLMKKKLKFTACGFFTIDHTLLQAMVATASTYMVVLLQNKDLQ